MSDDKTKAPPRLPRIVGEGDSGLDVMVYREALVALGLVPAADRGWFGPSMVAGVLAFQRRAGITPHTGTEVRDGR